MSFEIGSESVLMSSVLWTDVYLSLMNNNVDNVCIVYTVYNAELRGFRFPVFRS